MSLEWNLVSLGFNACEIERKLALARKDNDDSPVQHYEERVRAAIPAAARPGRPMMCVKGVWHC